MSDLIDRLVQDVIDAFVDIGLVVDDGDLRDDLRTRFLRTFLSCPDEPPMSGRTKGPL